MPVLYTPEISYVIDIWRFERAWRLPAPAALYWDLSTRKQVRYRDAGVNIDEADRALSSIKKLARQTFTRGVLTDIGSFGAAYG
jgi:hypothetical protein